MILGLSGDKGTVAAYLIKEHGFERRAFADPMKETIAGLLNVPFNEIDRLKDSRDNQVILGNYDQNDATYDSMRAITEMSFHEFISRFADSHREVFGDDFWLDFTMPMSGFYHGLNIVVTDMRHDNEAVRVRSCGGFRVHVENPEAQGKPAIAAELIDYYIRDDGPIEELTDKIEKMLVDLATVDYRYKMILRDE